MGTAINMVGMKDIEKPLPSTIDWKVTLPKKNFISVFKTMSSGTCLLFASSHGFSTLPSKATVQESPPSFFKAPTIESIIVILSVMCIVPKYHIVFCMIVILLSLKFLVLVSFKTPEELLHLCFASLMEASEIPL